jgi:hypothetical protein
MVWNDLFRPVRVGSDVDDYVLLTPERVRLQKLVCDDRNVIKLHAVIDANSDMVMATPVFANRRPTVLPDLLPDPASDAKFHMLLPVRLQLSELNYALSGRSDEKPISMGVGAAVNVRRLSFYTRNANLYVRVDIEAENKQLSKRLAGTLFLSCGLAYDGASRELRVAAANWCGSTRQVLSTYAPWLLQDDIGRRVQETVKIDIGPELRRQLDAANDCYRALSTNPAVRFRSHLDTLRFEGIQARDDGLIADFDLSGTMSCDISTPKK